MDLTVAEGRVLGCLIEREAVAPEAYPVTLNDLRLACNQTSGRDPVVAYDDRTVEDTLLALKSKGLARFVLARAPGERTTRYRHRADERWRLGRGDLAVLATLLLQGVQPVSEVRERARRLASFADPGDVDAVLDMLAARTPTPFATRLEADGAGGETRWAQVLTGPFPRPPTGEPAAGAAPLEGVPPPYADLAGRVADLEQRLAHALERQGPSTARDADQPPAPDARPGYRSSDWRDDPTLPPPPPPPEMSGNHLATLPQLTVAEDTADLAERVHDIERRLARIEAELAALR
ncbi:MAG TPA: DUF480 domain-containing protein [Acidimicrobiales bacterium]|nr:DUF480 domain-containing protein [Acidimicrobiales bacterium]